MEFSIPTLDSKIIIKRMSLNATIRIEIDSPSENENAPDQKVRLVFQGNRPIQGIVRMEGAAAAPPIYFSLDPQHQETTISLPDGGWGAENTLVYLETDEQIITRRTRLLPRTAVSRLCCWPPILYWKDAENPLTIGAFKEHSSNLDLTVIFPPELARSRVEKDKPESSTLSLYLSAENLPNAWIGMITVRDRISRAVGRIPILRSQTKETKPTP